MTIMMLGYGYDIWLELEEINKPWFGLFIIKYKFNQPFDV